MRFVESTWSQESGVQLLWNHPERKLNVCPVGTSFLLELDGWISFPPLHSNATKAQNPLQPSDSSLRRMNMWCSGGRLTSENKRSSSDDEDECLGESAGSAQRISPGVTLILELIRPLLAAGWHCGVCVCGGIVCFCVEKVGRGGVCVYTRSCVCVCVLGWQLRPWRRRWMKCCGWKRRAQVLERSSWEASVAKFTVIEGREAGGWGVGVTHQPGIQTMEAKCVCANLFIKQSVQRNTTIIEVN